MRERPKPPFTMTLQSLDPERHDASARHDAARHAFRSERHLRAGQLYDGLSLARSLAGLTLAQRVTPDHVLHDQRVRRYQAELFGLPEEDPDNEPVIA